MRGKGLSQTAIVDMALELIEADGVDALSMRGLGRALGVEAMSLYRYFGDKDTLLDAVQRRIVTEMRPIARRGGWRKILSASARELRRVLKTHPRGIILFVRPAASREALDAFSRPWQTLVDAGFSEKGAFLALQSLLAFVVGQALWQFPGDVERSVDDEFEFGLEVFLMGLEQWRDVVDSP
jgi:AcrR family transcriptional regulator